MKTKKTLLSLIALNMGIFCLLNPQSAPFNLDTYKDFLQENKDMTPTDLLEMYPAGYFLDDVNMYYEDALYFDTIESEYNLTADEKELIRKNGFVVTERLRQESFNDHFKVIYKRDLPVFISTDAILHAYHCSYDAILRDVELDYLIDKIKELLLKMHSSMDKLTLNFRRDTEMRQMLKDVDLYLTIPLKLLGVNANPYYPTNEKVIDELLHLIYQEQMVSYPIFSDDCWRQIDFSQFKPRGHYTQEERLEQYFRAMIWLGRTEIYLNLPKSDLSSFGCSEEQLNRMVTRQAVDALLLVKLLELSGANEDYEKFEEIISFFVGEQDNVTYPQLKSLMTELNINKASELLDHTTLNKFQQTLSTKSYAGQQIISQLLYTDPMSPDAVEAASAFMLFGQRFVIDSYITGNVVFDHILYQDNKICRLFPSTQDILFAFGNDASNQLVIPELQKYNYSSNLAGLRYLVDHYDNNFWESSLYCMWLKAIKTLNPAGPGGRDNLPAFMQTGAWGLEKMNSQLASWTELRHDNILYAKQSYTTGGACSYPCGYVEPNPKFYQVLNRTAQIAMNKFKGLPELTANNGRLIPYLEHLKAVTDTLHNIAEKELNGTCLTNDEIRFIKRLFIRESVNRSGYFPPTGWYPELFYYIEDVEKNDFLVADYHTTPTDCFGNMIGAVSHAGTGYIDMLITTVQMPDNQKIAFMGPVMSYHEYVTTNFLRLNDEEWKESYFQKSFRPEWANGYLADNAGKSYTSVQKLASSQSELETMLDTDYNPVQVEMPNTFEVCPIHIVSAPNPIRDYTVISFTVPEVLRNGFTTLSIYDTQGKVIQTLVNEVLPPGNYVTKWDCSGASGVDVPPGVYLVKIWVGNIDETLKVMVVR